eukprot:scpid27860/ scgid8847/ TGF-beta receptor type-1; Serine/threonine-protein kinase receptor R4; TGF-beta type I receptor; Transforming growth factor-beta receptor type I
MALASDTSMRSAYVRSNHCHWRLVLLAGCLTCATLFYNNCCVQAEQGVVMLPTCDTCDPNMPCAGPDLRTCPCFPGERQILTFYYHRVQGIGVVRCYFFGCFPNNSTLSSRCDKFYAKCCDIGGDSNCSSWTKSILAKESEGLRPLALGNGTVSKYRGPDRTCWRHTVPTTMPTTFTMPTNLTVPTTVPPSVLTTSPLEGSATTATSYLEGSTTTPSPPPAIETPPLLVTTTHPVEGAQKDTFRFPLIPIVIAISMAISVATFVVVYLTCSRGRHVKRGITGWRQLHYTCSLKKKLGLQVQPLDSEDLNQDQQQLQCEKGIFEEISLGDQIGSGQFADWHRGIWRGQMVTLKLFKATAGEQFDREVQHSSIYMMRHESIALYHDAGQRQCSTTITTTSTTTNDKDATAARAESVRHSFQVQPWIIVEYHPNGSLFDFLSRYCYPDVPADERLGIEDMRQMTLSVVAGLTHLHSHVQGQYFGCKPSIAHRNLKSKNILVKQDGTCCISDLSLAISRDNKEDGEHYVNEASLMVGDARYTAPEVLDGSISRSSFEEFRAADVYSLALIIWELAHACCPANGSSPAYSKPYADSIPEVPSSKDVYEAVCIRKCRPPLPKHWLENEVLSVIHRIINTSWKEHGQKRFSANRIWRNVQALETVKVKRPDNTVM